MIKSKIGGDKPDIIEIYIILFHGKVEKLQSTNLQGENILKRKLGNNRKKKGV
ncbi:MAG: hypothetical protein Ct9H300mP23_02290 [Nitrospinota bacterium]|nr:MAG: hypothetical protein Ct9H300mP23_02290 [Nitrospinota bacterium]